MSSELDQIKYILDTLHTVPVGTKYSDIYAQRILDWHHNSNLNLLNRLEEQKTEQYHVYPPIDKNDVFECVMIDVITRERERIEKEVNNG